MSDNGEEELDEEAIIPEEDFREAIAACCRDPELDRYFSLAPRGAKLFIGLGFYSTYFGDKVDPDQFAECQAEIEPALAPDDLKYLIRFERDKDTKRYLRELLARREAEAVAQPEPEPVDVPVQVPRRKRRRAAAPLQAEDGSDGFRKSSAFRIAALVAVILGGAFLLYFVRRPAPPQPPPQHEQVAEAPVEQEAPAPEMPSRSKATVRAERPARSPRSEQAPVPSVDADEADALLHGTVALVPDAPGQPAVDEAAAARPPAGDGKLASSRRQNVVFTDGRAIVRRPNGKIEVPRVFSCAGAGIRPFWVYGAHPEEDAAKERKARAEWQALFEQAAAAERGTDRL